MTNKVPVLNRKLIPPVAVGMVVGLAVGTLLTLDTTRQFMIAWWWTILLFALAILALVWRFLTSKLPSHRRAGLVSFIAVPVLLLLVGGIALLPQELQLVSLRGALLLIVCLLPATLWYLFIATRKASLLNEFLANLDRLGLLRPRSGEDLVAKRRRVSSYLQRFGAIYGDLPKKIYKDVQANSNTRYSNSAISGTTGLSTMTVPVLISTGLIAIGWLLTLPPVDVLAIDQDTLTGPTAEPIGPWVSAITPRLEPATSAFIGAYFFSLQMLFRRYALKDLRGAAYMSVSMRIVLALIGVWVLSAVNELTGNFLSPATLFALSFAIGVFPHIIWQVIEQALKRIKFLTVPSMRPAIHINTLDGITVWHEARLQEEDIENVPNLASADLVDLLLNTRLAPDRIIDWTDQAILYTYLGPNRHEIHQRLHARGIRTATAFLQLLARKDELANVIDELQESGTTWIPTLAIGLQTNSNLELILCWRGIDKHSSRPHSHDTVSTPTNGLQEHGAVSSLQRAAE